MLDLDKLEAHNTALLARLAEVEAALADANSLCRSAFIIASRGGRETNWSSFTDRLAESLVRQHRVMYPGKKYVVDDSNGMDVRDL